MGLADDPRDAEREATGSAQAGTGNLQTQTSWVMAHLHWEFLSLRGK